MKKVLFIAALALLGFSNVNAQDGSFNVGANIGITTGDADVSYGLMISAEANYLFEVADEFKVGPSVSYVNYFGKTINGFDIDNASFIPLAAAGRFNASEKFDIGLDLGYGIGISPDGNDGGFYYRPLVGYKLNEQITLQAAYSGVSVDGGTFSNLAIGVMFAL